MSRSSAPSPAPRFIGSEVFRHVAFGGQHPLRIPRVSTVIDLSRAMGWLPGSAYITSPRARAEALTAWHDPDYIRAFFRADAEGVVRPGDPERYGLGTLSNPVFTGMVRRASTAAGGSLLAGALLKDGGVIYHPAGGTHHGLPGRAGGFCYLNDPMHAILSLRHAGVRRVAYVDIDAHHPDGVAVGLEGDPDALLISVHEENRWPFTGVLEDRGGGQHYNLPVPKGLNDTEMAAIRDALILPLVQAFRPEAVVLQCGADAVAEDPLARLDLSNNAHWAMVAALRPLAPRYLVLGGGGYNPWTVGRLWTGVWATLAGAEIPDRLPDAGAEVLRDLSWSRLRGRPLDPAWTETLRDPPRDGPVRDEIRNRIRDLTTRRLGTAA